MMKKVLFLIGFSLMFSNIKSANNVQQNNFQASQKLSAWAKVVKFLLSHGAEIELSSNVAFIIAFMLASYKGLFKNRFVYSEVVIPLWIICAYWMLKQSLSYLIGFATNPFLTRLKPGDRVFDLTQKFLAANNLKSRKVYLLQDPQVFNAYALDPKIVVVSSGLANILNDQELEAIIGHEVGHTNSGDSAVSTVLNLVVAIVPILLPLGHDKLIQNKIVSSARRKQWLFSLFISIMFGYPFLQTIINKAIERAQERRADQFAIKRISNPHELVNALVKFDVTQNSKQNWFKTLFLSHPHFNERKRLVEKFIAAKLKKQQHELSERPLVV